jgi:hypothetical protein
MPQSSRVMVMRSARALSRAISGLNLGGGRGRRTTARNAGHGEDEQEFPHDLVLDLATVFRWSFSLAIRTERVENRLQIAPCPRAAHERRTA